MPETAEFPGPSPKRRRIDRAPISPEQIAQTNATLSHFMGQRQNRWMQDYSASNTPGRSYTTASGQSTTNGQPSVPLAQAGGRAGRAGNERPRSMHDEARANERRRATLEGTTDASPATANPRGPSPTVVAYETPLVDNLPPTTISTDRQSGIQHTSLPSPAPSDENSGSVSATGQTGVPPPKRGPGRPRKHPLPVLASNGPLPTTIGSGRGSGSVPPIASRAAAIAPAPEQQQQQLRSPALTINPTDVSHPPSWRRGQHSPTMTNTYSSAALQARIDAFRANHLNHNSDIDKGRLQLLADAVTIPFDGFYVAVSQMHAVAAYNSSALPDIVRALPQDCWMVVDYLICPNTNISPSLLAFLADFPVPNANLRSTALIPAQYSGHITAVTNFLRVLPERWDGFITRCRAMEAPPLTQDLSTFLNLTSPILQSVAFRAVARLIWNTDNDVHILDHLEKLHQHDQQAWARGFVRHGEDATRGYWAFRRMRGAWQRWFQAWETSRGSIAPFHYHFALDAVKVFAPALVAQIQAQKQGFATTHHNPATTVNPTQAMMQQYQPHPQQQQNMNPLAVANLHGFSHGLNLPTTNMQSATPMLQNMPPRNSPHSGSAAVWMPPQKHPQGSRELVFPHERDTPRPQPTEPNPYRSALHQAHLRSPEPVPKQVDDVVPQLYRYVSHLALSPQCMDNTTLKTSFTFELSEGDFAKIPLTNYSGARGELDTRVLDEESQLYRLRCCKVPPGGFTSDSSWTMADTVWPSELYLNLNGMQLEMRRQLHHKKNLPIDITTIVMSGKNVIDVAINRGSTDTRPLDIAIAVEVVGVIAHSTLVDNIEKKQIISAADTKTAIQKSLTGTSNQDVDDDIAVVTTSMQIKLFDPFSGSRIFDTPVRGATCTHKDCFDLKIYLSQCKRDKPGAPTVVDCWRCPLCRGDVRPQNMVRDEWLADVRKQLEAQGKLDTRAIIVEADGSWKPKPEQRTGVRSASMEREEQEGQGAAKKAREGEAAETMPAPKKTKKVIEVIELD